MKSLVEFISESLNDKKLLQSLNDWVMDFYETGFDNKDEADEYFQAIVDGGDNDDMMLDQFINTMINSKKFSKSLLNKERENLSSALVGAVKNICKKCS